MRSAFEWMEFESFRIANGAIKLTTPTFQEKKRSICARRFPKGDRKALWWGDGAKPHI